MANVRTIRWLAGGGFVDKEVTSVTVSNFNNSISIEIRVRDQFYC